VGCLNISYHTVSYEIKNFVQMSHCVLLILSRNLENEVKERKQERKFIYLHLAEQCFVVITANTYIRQHSALFCCIYALARWGIEHYKLGFGALKWLCCVGYFLQSYGGEGRVAGYGQAPCFIPGTRSQIFHGSRS
jgi:hypothetical protein